MTTRTRPPTHILLLLLAVLIASSAQQVLYPILAPLSRRLGITELQLGLLITTAALMLALTSPRWGRAVDELGARRVLVLALALSSAGLFGFAVLSTASLDEGVSGLGYVGLLLTRGVLFGIGLAALPVAALAAVSAASDSANRTRFVSLVGAAQALALILGPGTGGLMATAGLLVPLWAAPALVGVAALVAGLSAPRRAAVPVPAGGGAGADGLDDGGEVAAPPVRLRPWSPQVWPLLATGFGLYLCLGTVTIILGFLVQDRLELSDRATASAVGVALVVTGVMLFAVQAVLVPRLMWPPLRLLRVGIPIAALALLGLSVADTLPLITASLVALAAGLGIAVPGYQAAPTLLVGPDQQGRIAGWVSATTGWTLVIAPSLGAGLYGVSSALPGLFGAAVAVTLWLFVLGYRGLRP